MKEKGFVLRRFLPKKQKCSVFTFGRGKIDLACGSERDVQKLWPGMLISFTSVQSTTSIYFGSDLEILFAPLSINYFSLELVHHILEICYYFMPPEDLAENVFNYIEHIFIVLSYKMKSILASELAHRLCIIGLFMECGFFPSSQIASIVTLFIEEVFAFVDFPKKASVQSLEKAMNLAGVIPKEIYDEWVQSCVNEHPYARNFKIFI